MTNQESASNASEAGAANVQDPVEVEVASVDVVEPSPSEAVADPMAVRDPEGMAWSQGASQVESLPAKEEQGQKPTGETITKAMTWHVDIARYYGTVPSADVAVLLFQSADWGVRSWTMRGQTTYYSRSLPICKKPKRCSNRSSVKDLPTPNWWRTRLDCNLSLSFQVNPTCEHSFKPSFVSLACSGPSRPMRRTFG